jgi:hypothetical protein
MITQAVSAMLVVMSTTMPAATAGPTTVSAPTDPIRIGLDAGTPPGHNFGYNDFFPRAGVRVHRGDLVNFAWASTPDGLHNVAVLRQGTSATRYHRSEGHDPPTLGPTWCPVSTARAIRKA